MDRSDSNSLLQWFEESRVPSILFFVVAGITLAGIGVDTRFSLKDLGSVELIAALAAAVPAGFLLIVSLGALACYFIFIPSITHDGHLFSSVHGTHLIHPLNTAIVLGLGSLCLFTGSRLGGGLWGLLLVVYLVQTVVIVRRVRKEHLVEGVEGEGPGTFFLLLNLILGTEIITVAAGARPLPPWRLKSLPEDTWIVDVRTKPEFHWNRLRAAENYPWGAGVIEAARDKPKDQPVVVTCFSGHRSPAVAVMLRRLGFKTVYNLNWGLLYLILLERGNKTEGPFSLTRPHRDPARRGEDFRGICIAYITLQFIILILAPLEWVHRFSPVPLFQQVCGAIFGLGGLALGVWSYRALGRNFRVFAAPRRSGALVTTGIYSRVRHPMYTAVIVMFAGYILFFGSLLSVPLWIAFSALYVYKTGKEERILAARFPEYDEYRKRTHRFIPGVY